MMRPVFIYDDGYLKYDFGGGHILRKERLVLARKLLQNYGLIGSDMSIELEPSLASYEDLMTVHDRDYLEVLMHLSQHPEGSSFSHGLGASDNPVFPGMFEAASLQVGGTSLACDAVAKGEAERAMNIGGGFHHALPARASGFCLLNDVAIGIRRLLSRYDIKRVMYVDIDAHHADGVQAIFYDDPRVLNVSLHEDGQYLFPGTGDVEEIGAGEGEGFTVNLPLPPFTDDAGYLFSFMEVVIPLTMAFKPEILFTQLGADAHYNDPLAHLKLTTRSYEEIAKKFHEISEKFCGRRWIAVTGGGYDIVTCPRIWALFFSNMQGKELSNDLPIEWMEYCKTAHGVTAENGTLRDPVSISDQKVVSSAVEKVVDKVRNKVFKYHGLV